MKTETEIERKFIIGMPDMSELSAMEAYTESKIRQTYLDAPAGVTHRVRERVYQGKTVYTENTKIRIDRMSCRESEGEITRERYEALLREKKPGTRTLEKTRVTFFFAGHTLEIDRYPEWRDSCIMEVELEDRDEKILFPDLIRILREVTGNKSYTNASMAVKMPPEDRVSENLYINKENKMFTLQENCEKVELGGGVSRKVLAHDETMMAVEVSFEKGAVGAVHTHPHTQISYVLEGSFDAEIGGKHAIIKKGDTYYVQPNVPHGVTALENGKLLDVFTPERKDFLAK